jgi:hypothetical protein
MGCLGTGTSRRRKVLALLGGGVETASPSAGRSPVSQSCTQHGVPWHGWKFGVAEQAEAREEKKKATTVVPDDRRDLSVTGTR